MPTRRILIAGAILVAAAAAALAATAASDAPALFAPGHQFGVGEQHVYAVQIQETLTLRFRNPLGELTTKTVQRNVHRSVALTVEGYNAANAPVLAIATTAPTVAARPGQAPSAPPSPTIGVNGQPSDAGSLADIAPAAALFGGLESAPQLGSVWSASGDVPLPLGHVSLRMKNVANLATGDTNQTTLVVTSSGSADVFGRTRIAPFGDVSLRGSGSAGGTSYIDADRALLLGLQITSRSHGNASLKTMRGVYDLSLTYSIELAKFVAGVVPPSLVPQFVISSGALGSQASTDTSNFGPVPMSSIAAPGPVDTEFVPSPQPTPTPSPIPGVSIPPIPLAVPSGQHLVSPPPEPSPSPTLFRPRP